MKKILVAATVALMTAGSANAATLLVSYVANNDPLGGFTFNVDSNPLPIFFSTFSFSAKVTNATGLLAYNTAITFYTNSAGGLFYDFVGQQVFSGPPTAPTILTGTYSAVLATSLQAGVVTISDATAAVPEPATWAMFIGGFGMIGGAMRRRQKISVRFA